MTDNIGSTLSDLPLTPTSEGVHTSAAVLAGLDTVALHYITPLSAWLGQLVNATTQMHVQSCTVEFQLHSRADSLTQASIPPRSVK